MSSTGDPPAESAAVQAFIAARQGELLAKAVATLEDCADDDLAAESHRLAGTLGTYQLTTAQVAMRNLESAVTATGIGKADIDHARAATLAAMRGLLADHRADTGGDGSP